MGRFLYLPALAPGTLGIIVWSRAECDLSRLEATDASADAFRVRMTMADGGKVIIAKNDHVVKVATDLFWICKPAPLGGQDTSLQTSHDAYRRG
jgi:hypothetical protein